MDTLLVTSRSSPFPALSLLALLLTAFLAGCGQRLAVVPDRNGEPLMLLGHDSVAYFTEGKAIRGNPDIVERYEGSTYYFASEQHRAMFVQAPAATRPNFALSTAGSTFLATCSDANTG